MSAEEARKRGDMREALVLRKEEEGEGAPPPYRPPPAAPRPKSYLPTARITPWWPLIRSRARSCAALLPRGGPRARGGSQGPWPAAAGGAEWRELTPPPPRHPTPAPQWTALLSKLKVLARENCRREVQAYVDCTNAAGLAVVWSCRESLGEMNKCLGQWTSDEALAETRRQWVEAGRRQDLAWRPDLSKVVGGQP